MKGDPLRSQNHDELKSPTLGPTNIFFFKVFFRLRIFFFQEKKNFFLGTTFVQFFMYCKAKKKFRSDPKFFENLLHKKGPKGGISIDADSGPPRYVL